MSAPTKGPWFAVMDDNDIWVTPPDREAPVICDLLPRDADVFTEEDEANARLISAAPDLLIAAKAALHDRMYTDWPGIADLLIAAIAKAEGGHE